MIAASYPFPAMITGVFCEQIKQLEGMWWFYSIVWDNSVTAHASITIEVWEYHQFSDKAY